MEAAFVAGGGGGGVEKLPGNPRGGGWPVFGIGGFCGAEGL